MTLPPDPDQDTFDFGGSSRQQGQELFKRLLSGAEGRGGLPKGQGQQVAIAAAAVGAMWVAPILAGAKRKRRRRARRERREAERS